jgi:hypothetical protein
VFFSVGKVIKVKCGTMHLENKFHTPKRLQACDTKYQTKYSEDNSCDQIDQFFLQHQINQFVDRG